MEKAEKTLPKNRFELFKEIVKKAFVSQEKNINRGAKAQIDKKVDELFNILTLGS